MEGEARLVNILFMHHYVLEVFLDLFLSSSFLLHAGLDVLSFYTCIFLYHFMSHIVVCISIYVPVSK